MEERRSETNLGRDQDLGGQETWERGSRVFMLGSRPQGNDGILYNILCCLV